jgi:hypothetical protein
MLKMLSQLEHTVENKVCRFVCEHDTPIAFVKEALFQFQKYIGQLEDQAKAQQAQQAEAATKVQAIAEEPKPA